MYGAWTVKNLPAMQETQVRSLSLEDPREKEMATLSRILVWEIQWAEEPGELQSQRVGRDLATKQQQQGNVNYISINFFFKTTQVVCGRVGNFQPNCFRLCISLLGLL